MPNVIVTGGAGFIGSNLTDALMRRGDQVTVLDSLSTGRRSNLDEAIARGATLLEVDVRDGDAVAGAFASVQPELVFHLAAQIDVRRSVSDPEFDASVNVGGTINVLRAGIASGVARLVNSSTGGAIYGDARQIPTPEEHPQAPDAPYGVSKGAAERYCEFFGRTSGLSTISLRYGNVYGPRQDPMGEAGVVAIFCGCVRSGSRPTIYGDGKQTRDYVFVDDVVRANLLAADSGATGSVNIGGGVETTVLELVAHLDKASEGGLQADHAPERPGELRRSALDAGKAAQLLGWEAEVGVAEGLQRTLDSQRSTPR
ncbi:MAG: UDP-glucose 4-epimerase [Thermoleophilaceae bacterium]|jgi:UDP-glucose 4-epimerase|nr:UDP-glucose 4-epimerase [Thermoleophilaceae bacterium]